ARRLRRAPPLDERPEIAQQGGAARQQKEIHCRTAPAAGARLGRSIAVWRGKSRFFPPRAVDAAATAGVINCGGAYRGSAMGDDLNRPSIVEEPFATSASSF